MDAPPRIAVRLLPLLASMLVFSSCIVAETEISPPAQNDGGIPRELPEGVHYVGPGAEATTFLRADHPRLVIEVDQAEGHEFRAEALEHLQGVLESVLDKPDGIEIRTSTFRPQQDEYSLDDMRALEEERRETSTDGGTASMYVLALNGRFSDGPGAIGSAFSASSFAVFVEQMREAVGPLRPVQIQGAVLTHEAGHLLSLVNIGYTSPRDREDPEHPNHSANEDSVMHWAVETASIADLLTRGVPNDFDEADRADLEAVRRGDLTVDFSQ